MQGFVELSEEQRQQFRNEGYLIVRNVLDSAAISSMIEAGDRLIATDERLNRYSTSAYYDGFRNCITMDEAFHPAINQRNLCCPW